MTRLNVVVSEKSSPPKLPDVLHVDRGLVAVDLLVLDLDVEVALVAALEALELLVGALAERLPEVIGDQVLGVGARVGVDEVLDHALRAAAATEHHEQHDDQDDDQGDTATDDPEQLGVEAAAARAAGVLLALPRGLARLTGLTRVAALLRGAGVAGLLSVAALLGGAPG